MDDFLDHTANVTVSFSIIEVSERRWSFVEPSVRSENRSSTFSGWVKQVRNVVDDGETTPWGEQNQPAS
jgi:tRNA A58 N-methylase Trm61